MVIFRQLDDRRATLKWERHRVARGGTKRRVMFMRSYRAVIPLPELVQAGSRVALLYIPF